MVEIFATHGTIAGWQSGSFAHKNLLDMDRFISFLKSTERFVPLSEAIKGHGRALTIDDATVASGSAARLARAYGHAVTLFVNPWQIEDGRPYPASRMDGLLDQIQLDVFPWDNREFHLNSFEGKYELRTYFKSQSRRHRFPEENNRLIEDIERCLGVHWQSIPDHMQCLSLEQLRELHSEGVQIENHYWTHLDPAAHSLDEFSDNFLKANYYLLRKLNVHSKFFASPFGEYMPPVEFLRQNETLCFLLHDDLPEGMVDDLIVNRITLHV